MTHSETKMETISKKALTQRHSDYRLRQSCVGFVLTERCPVGCRHCINDSTMQTSRPRDLTKQLEWIAAVGKSGLCENVNITGGEPFLNFEDLVILIRTIRDHRMRPTLVTSAVWATDDDITRLKLERLAAAGLNGIAVSADEFHQENVPLANVARVLAESRSRGIALGIALAYMENSDTPTRKVRALKRDLGPELLRDVTIVKGPIIKAGRA